MGETEKTSAPDPELLAILRCPKGVREPVEGGEPGLLRLVHGCWLVCDQTGLKYPIVDGIPIMLEEVGEQYVDTPEEELPVPPPKV